MEKKAFYLEEGYLLERIKRIVTSRLKASDELFGSDHPLIFEHQSTIVRTAIKDVEKFIKWVNEEYPKQARARKGLGLKKWELEDAAYYSMLQRAKMFKPLHNCLWKNTMPFFKSEELAERVGKHKKVTRKGQEVEDHYVIVVPNYDDIILKLKMSRSSAKKYMKAYCKYEVLKDLGKLGPNKQKAYAIGYWVQYEGKEGKVQFRRVPFLTRKLRNKLRTFTVREQGD